MKLQSSLPSVRDHTPVLREARSEMSVPRHLKLELAAGAQTVPLDEKSLRRAMAWFVVPQTASGVLQLASSTITVVYYGQLLGPSALAVASVFFPVFLLLISFLIGLVSSGGVATILSGGVTSDITVSVNRERIPLQASTTLSVCCGRMSTFPSRMTGICNKSMAVSAARLAIN